MSCLRDVANGLYEKFNRDYHYDILESYSALQLMDTSLLFSYKIETVKYSGSIYRGTLSELIEVCLTHVYQFLESDDLASIEQIHDFAIIELGPKITAERVETVL